MSDKRSLAIRQILAVKPSWVYDAVRTGRLPCLRVGRHIRFTQTMLENWLTESAGATRQRRPAKSDRELLESVARIQLGREASDRAAERFQGVSSG